MGHRITAWASRCFMTRPALLWITPEYAKRALVVRLSARHTGRINSRGAFPHNRRPLFFEATDLITVNHTIAITPFTSAEASYFMITRQQASLAKTNLRRSIMKTILSALVALSFVAGTVAPAAAYEGFSIKTLDQDGRGGHAN